MEPPRTPPAAPTPARATTRTAASRPASPAENLLRALGADPSFVEAVLGDLAEEYALRAARDGGAAARWWYACETLRSAPHFVLSAIRQGDPRARVRLAACGAVVALALTLAVTAVLIRDGAPARLVAGVGDAADGIVINNLLPVQLPVRVLDAAGHALATDSVRYRWESGARVSVSASGVVTCTERGDAMVRASLGPIATDVEVRCRPVRQIDASTWISLVAGEPARHLPFEAIGLDGRPVMQLRGEARVLDSAVAALDGASIRPRAVGETAVVVKIGDRGARIRVLVHEPVNTFAGLRPDQRLVAVPVRLARGDTVHWALPNDGVFWLKYVTRRPGEPPPTITLDGPVGCFRGDGGRVYRLPIDEYGTYCVAHGAGVSVTVAHGRVGAPVVDGWLALERVEQR
ncbi:MAG TPA: hypothetical protein VFS44_10635 [Gemmatimonadaceae bacterium]|nr:hypothetical protein [Gemmatimonadaceae bacterium]